MEGICDTLFGAMDLTFALKDDQPKGIKDYSPVEEKNVYDKWERSNRMSLMVIRCTIPESLRDTVAEEATKAKVLLQEQVRKCLYFLLFLFLNTWDAGQNLDGFDNVSLLFSR